MSIYDKLRFAENEKFLIGEDEAEKGSATEDRLGGTHVPPQLSFSPSKNLDKSLKRLGEVFYSDINKDIIIRRFMSGSRKAAVVFIDGITDEREVNDAILRPMMRRECASAEEAMMSAVMVKSAEVLTEGEAMVRAILDGNAIALLDGDKRAVSAEVRSYPHRSVGEAVHEKVLKGPQQGFVEHMRTNISLIRAVVRTPDLVTEMLPTGGDNNLKCALLYRKGTAPQRVVDRVRESVAQASGKGFVLGSGMLEQLMRKKRMGIIPRTMQTERPDRAASYITTGHVCIVCEGYPFVMVMPVTFFSLMQTSDDYFITPVLATCARIVRYGSLFITMFLPAIYTALIVYHRALLPVKFLISSQALRQLVAIPVFGEILLMSAVFELLREASMRVQSGVNQTLGIIGGLILGQAAVSANIVSPIAIIIVAATGLASYAIPDYGLQMAAYRMRLVFLLGALVGGLWGIMLVFIPFASYAASCTSCGAPFFAPVSPKTRHNVDLIKKGRAGRMGDIEDYIRGGGNESNNRTGHN